MVMSLIVIALVGLSAYLWSAQGFFSAFIHFVCVVVAGAIAFALWEPLTYGVLLGLHPRVQEMAFGAGLLVPFVASLALLRLATNKALPKGLDFDDATNFAGGLAFGALSGVIVAGFITLAVGFFRMPASIFGHQSVAGVARGAVEKGGGLLLPADRLTLGFYEMLSRGAFSTATPLATVAPGLHEQAAANRLTFGDIGRSSAAPGDLTVNSEYRIEGSGERTIGYVVTYGAGAKEKWGQIVVAPGQLRLVARNPQTGEVKTLHPTAAVGRKSGASLDIGRWSFDVKDVYFSSVGGASTASFALEFGVPAGFDPLHLYFRNVRTALPQGGTPATYASAADRDAALGEPSGSPFEAIASGAVVETQASAPQRQTRTDDPVTTFGRIPVWIGAFNRQNRGGLDLDEQNRILDGQVTLDRALLGVSGLPGNLRVDQFASTADTRIVQLEVSVSSRLSVLGKAMDAAESVAPPVIVDNLGQQYQAVGYIHDAGPAVTIRFTPGNPIRAMRELPTLSESRPDERLVLVFRASAGVDITKFQIGNRVIEEFDPPLDL